MLFFFFFFNDTATTEIYTLSLHDALPISSSSVSFPALPCARSCHTSPAPAPRSRSTPSATRRKVRWPSSAPPSRDRKSTRLNSSHDQISYAVFCLKKKKKHRKTSHHTIMC